MATTTRSERHWQRSVSMLGACLATTTAGTVYLFSTYGPALSRQLHLSSTQSNLVAISANYGLLLSGPLFGWLADTLGPRILCAFAAVGSFSAFSALAYTYSGDLGFPGWVGLAGYMVLVGVSCQAVNMSAITVTTRNFKENRGAAVSLCIAFFGLSPFVLSHVNSWFFAGSNGGPPDVFGFLKFLAMLGLVTSLLAAVSLSVVGFGPSRYRRDIPHGFIADGSADSILEESMDEESGLVGPAQPGYSAGVDSATDAATDSAPAIAANAGGGGPGAVDYDTARDLGGKSYIRDHEAQLLALVLFFCAGVGVFYNNNVGTIVTTLYHSSVAHPDASTAQRLINRHVGAISMGSFLGRLSIGIITDLCKRIWHVPRSGILVGVVSSTVISQLVILHARNLEVLLVGSVLTGVSYGFIFGFVPLLVSVWFGTRHFGSNWGMTSLFIGFSGQGLGAFFGFVYDRNLPDQDLSKCPGGVCYRSAFLLSTLVAACGWVAAAVLAGRRARRRRENRRMWEAEEYDRARYVPFRLAE
ncbi:hypothetical protein LPJ66_001348 [Kickxella alabastrina]|uniref:Uncharacterized protein n=1 Tax=Kickxella alabastrina TaxID=61397 RepID=A0ACC1ITK7_9FUNG|nr:hypothetical protein LPJ66_001348 [Kickxella alabastrina]